MTQVTLPDGKMAQNVFSGRFLDHTVDPAGTQVGYSYCAPCGALTGVSGPLGWALSIVLDGDHDTTRFVDARNMHTDYSFGQAGEPVQTTYPDGSGGSVLYDDVGQVRQLTNSRNQNIHLGYDVAGRVVAVDFPTTGNQHIYYFYNTDNTLQYVFDSAGGTSFTYTPGGQVASVVYNYTGLTNPQELDYVYNPDGSRQSVTWKNGNTVVGTWQYHYNAAGLLNQVTSPWNEVTGWGYDGETKLTSQTNSNNTALYIDYNQQRGWPTALTYTKSGVNFARYSLTYDNAANTVGNLTGVSELDGSSAGYGYDGLYRLTSDSRTGTAPASHSYRYDLAGNATLVNGTAFVYDAANKLTSYGGAPVTSDADGDVTAIGTGISGLGIFSWDELGHLTGQTVNNLGGGIGYVYDAFGHRVYAYGFYRPTPTFYIYDGDLLLGEVQQINGSSNVSAAYTWGAAGLVSERLVQTNTSLWYAFGPQGETRQLTNASGVLVDSYVYSAYGTPLMQGTDVNPFQYGGQTGYYTDNANGIILCGARWYDPWIGRWLSRDPIGYGGGANLFGYCVSNPIGWVDPDGHDREKPWYDRAGDWLNKKIGDFCAWTFDKAIHLGGTVKMKKGTPTLQTAYIDPECPETIAVNGRYSEAGHEVSRYIKVTGGMIIITVALGVIHVTPSGTAVEALEGTSPFAGNWAGIRGQTVGEVISRVPKGWVMQDTKGVGGIIWRDPAAAATNWVRVMPGNQLSNFQPYLRIFRNGSYVDEYGHAVISTDPVGHIFLVR